MTVTLVKLDPDNLRINYWLRRRPLEASKWDFGHALVVGGDLGMGGASCLAGEAALRIGAGMVSLATRPEHVIGILAGCPELMVHGVPTTETWSTILSPLLTRANVLMVGSGLGHGDWGRAAFKAVIGEIAEKVWVVDADGLNLLAETAFQSDHWILTPHIREASRLLGQPVADLERDRAAAVTALQEKYGGIAVLKGQETLIKAAEGPVFVSDQGNPGMATAGMGDVLSGIIGGLLAQKVPLADAAKLGVYIHALAGTRAANAGGERGMKAGDLLPFIREVANWDKNSHQNIPRT